MKTEATGAPRIGVEALQLPQASRLIKTSFFRLPRNIYERNMSNILHNIANNANLRLEYAQTYVRGNKNGQDKDISKARKILYKKTEA
jgi:hypothetical protein